MTPFLPVLGTHSYGRTPDDQEWWHCLSPFCEFMKREGFRYLGPFIWSSNLDGILGKHHDWQAAGWSLYYYLRPSLNGEEFADTYVPPGDRNLIAHSHAMQVVAYACSYGLKINNLITVGSPVRNDMDGIYKLAKPNIRRWRHVHSDTTDKMQWLGEMFDGRWGIYRRQTYADVNVKIPNVAHSRLLTDPACFPIWRDTGLLDFLRTT